MIERLNDILGNFIEKAATWVLNNPDKVGMAVGFIVLGVKYLRIGKNGNKL